jgi:ssRNA-specific RNase YbeY (16S rRNA maturation enzyme)
MSLQLKKLCLSTNGLATEYRLLGPETVFCAQIAPHWTSAGGGTLTTAPKSWPRTLAYGLLHLAGYDQRGPQGFGSVQRHADQLLGQLGVEPVFRAGG